MKKNGTLAWCAGFFDGEGSIYYAKTGEPNRRGRLAVSIGQVRREPLERFLSQFPIGRINGPYRSKALAIVVLLWPWLTNVKKEQARKAIRKVTRRLR